MSYRKDLTAKPHAISGEKIDQPSQRKRVWEDTYAHEEYEYEYQKHAARNTIFWKQYGWFLAIKIIFILMLILFLMSSSFAQDQKRSQEEADFENRVEELFQMQEADVDYSDLYESLFQYYTQPLNLNHADAQELASLYILSEQQIQSLLQHRQRYGKLLSIYELQAVEHFDLLTIRKLLPFIEIKEDGFQQDNRTLWQKIKEEENNFILFRYERTFPNKKGYQIEDTTRSRYLGSPDKLYMRYRVAHSQDFSLGFTAEKDAGEQLIWDTSTKRYGVDFLSAHAFVQNRGNIKSAIIGDYQLQIGQGLLLSGGFAVGKGAETINTLRRTTSGIRPYTSVMESNFLRGGAITYALKPKFHLTGFASFLRRDARLNTAEDTLSQEEDFINSLQATGYHRTPNEIAAKGNAFELTQGIYAHYRGSRNIEGGILMMNTHFSHQLQKLPTVYNQYEFKGKNNFVIAGNFNYTWRNFAFFGEAGRSQSGGLGMIGGFLASLSSALDISMLFRNYDRHFHSFYGNAFSEGTRNINERGLYWGIKFKPHRKWQLTAYYDKFWFPWLKYLVDAPSEGYEYLGRLMYAPTKKLSLYFHFREESRQKNWNQESTPFYQVKSYYRRNYQWNIDYKAEKTIGLRSKILWSTYKLGGKTTQGYAIIQDFNVDFKKIKLSTRFALFDTDDYENRQYAYEKDVLYIFYIPAYYGKGFRNYYVLQLNPHKKIDIWLKYAFTHYQHQESISSGLETIIGNRRHDWRIQLRWTF